MTRKIKSSVRLPSLPTVAVEVLRIFNDPDSRIEEITDVIQTDPAIASKILKAANSPRYGLRGEVSDLRRAVTLMGRANITPLVLSFSLSSESIEDPEYADHFRQFWLRSFVRANAAEILGERKSAGFGAECFTVNLLASVGQLGMLKQNPEAYVECLDRLSVESKSLGELEEDVFGISHNELSAEMLERINMPDRCAKAVRFDSSIETPEWNDEQEQLLCVITRCAEAAARYLCDPDPGLAFIALEERIAEINEFNPTDKEDLLGQIRDRLELGAELFNIDPSELPDSADLMDDAMEQLSEFTAMVHEPTTDRELPNELVEENGRLKRRVEDLIREASIDALTRVHNRAFFNSKLAELQTVSKMRGDQFGIVVIDIDHFKSVNDTHGHQAGDYVLKQVAQTLNSARRANEILARYGGEEFAILLEHTTAKGMPVVGERFRSVVEELHVVFEDTHIPITISVGVACGKPTDDEEFGTKLFALADEALYQAKHTGRNRVVVDTSFCDHTITDEFEDSEQVEEAAVPAEV